MKELYFGKFGPVKLNRPDPKIKYFLKNRDHRVSDQNLTPPYKVRSVEYFGPVLLFMTGTEILI